MKTQRDMKAVALCAFLILSGCITTSYKKSNVEYAHAFREFNMDVQASGSVRPGRYAGLREINGFKYHHLQFDGILSRAGRYLDVLLPISGGVLGQRMNAAPGSLVAAGQIVFQESSVRVDGTSAAYLVFQTTAPSNMDAFYALFNLQVGQESDPGAIMKKNFAYSLPDSTMPVFLVKLDFVINYSYSADAILWERTTGRSAVTARWIDIDGYDGPRMAIAWRERSKFVYGARQAGYVGTVIADVVTSPFQLLGLLFMALVGPVVR